LCYLRQGKTEKAKILYSEIRELREPSSLQAAQAAISDLKKLIDQGIMVEEVRMILTEIFGLGKDEM
jgi:hypothetical protein